MDGQRTKNVPFSAMDARYHVTYLVACRVLCDTVVGATSSEGFLVNKTFIHSPLTGNCYTNRYWMVAYAGPSWLF